MNQFFQKKGPFLLDDIAKLIKCKHELTKFSNKEIVNINDLYYAKNNELTFFNSIKYKEIAKKTNAFACITSQNLKKYLPSHCITLEVSNVFVIDISLYWHISRPLHFVGPSVENVPTTKFVA